MDQEPNRRTTTFREASEHEIKDIKRKNAHKKKRRLQQKRKESRQNRKNNR